MFRNNPNSDERAVILMEYGIAEYLDDGHEQPRWYYAHLSGTTRTALGDKDASLLRCRCGGTVTAAKLSASGADDGPAYLYCEACYQNDLHAQRKQHIPVAEDTWPIDLFDILWDA